jgi:hypothetical protein
MPIIVSFSASSQQRSLPNKQSYKETPSSFILLPLSLNGRSELVIFSIQFTDPDDLFFLVVLRAFALLKFSYERQHKCSVNNLKAMPTIFEVRMILIGETELQ